MATEAIIAAAILGALAGALAGRWAAEGRKPREVEETAYAVACGVCGNRYADVADVRAHLRDAHNAPGSRADVDELIVWGASNE